MSHGIIDQTYYKVTNENEIHFKFIYREGLNTLKGHFNDTGSCVAGGLYFTTLNHIHKFYDHGIYIREVTLPLDDPTFQVIKDVSGDKWRANKIILGKRYSLFDLNTYKILGLDITKHINLVDIASKFGNVPFLDSWKKSKIRLKYTNNSMDWASAFGRTDVLTWWLESGLKPKYSECAITYASWFGHVKTLEWWHYSGQTLLYDEMALNWATLRGHIKVLDWWIKRKLPMKYSSRIMVWASNSGKPVVLDWWNKLFIMCSDFAIIWIIYKRIEMCNNNNIDQSADPVIKWWLNSGLIKASVMQQIQQLLKNKFL